MFKWLRFNKKSDDNPQDQQLNDGSKNKKSIQHKLKRTYTYRVNLEMKRLKQAILSAENTFTPNRRELYALYKEVLRDAHVLTQLRTLRHKITAAPYELVDDSGNENEELKEELLDMPWMVKYINYWVDSCFWGHSLVEVLFKEGEVEKVWLVPREHVHPWTGLIVLDPNDIKGLPYRKPPLSRQMIEMGDPDDLGLLLVIAREAIWKNYARGDWSRFSERFGMPTLIVRAAGSNKKELDEKERMAQNMGASGYAILDDEDEVDLMEGGKTDAYKVYHELAKFCDEQISKVVLGQTGTTDEKSFVGSAEVHERTLDTYIWAMLKSLEFHLNHELLPFLTDNGYPLEGYRVRFPELYEKADATPGQEATEKKKTELSVDLPWVQLHEHCCGAVQVELADNPLFNLSKIINQAIDDAYQKKLKKGSLSADLWRYNVNQILKGIEQGGNQTFANLEYGDRYHDLLRKVRRNVYVFAAFKNHHNITDMVDSLTDEDGKTRSFSDFKLKAQEINKIYNENWLRSEYNTAIGQAQMAVKWEDVKQNAELFPWIQYVAINDDRTRPAHVELDGVTLRWDDEFWEQFFPPNGWNCRCTIRTYANAKEQKPDSLPSVTEVPPAFRHNSGSDGELYSKDHPYFANVSKEGRTNILSTMRNFILRENNNYSSALARIRQNKKVLRGQKDIRPDDAATINLYTTRAFQQVNLRLRKERLTDFEIYFKENLNEALDKLPNFKGEVYRVINTNVRPDFILDLIESGAKEMVDNGFSSSSYKLEWASKKLELAGGKWNVMMTIKSKTGKVIQRFSQKGTIFNEGQNQFEVTFKSGTTFIIENSFVDGNFIALDLIEK